MKTKITRKIQNAWWIEDVLQQNDKLTDEQASKVLEAVRDNFDAEQGINWDTIDYWIDELYPEEVESSMRIAVIEAK